MSTTTAEALAKAAAKQLMTLNTVLDSEGREVVVEEREDSEAKTKFQETVDLLVAAGKEFDRKTPHDIAAMYCGEHRGCLSGVLLKSLLPMFFSSLLKATSALASKDYRRSTRSLAA